MEEFVIRSLILTPESHIYALAIAIAFCAGIYTLSTLVQDRWLARWKQFDFWFVHVGTMTVVVLWCSFVLNAAALFHITLNNALVSILSAIGLAWAATRIDRAIVRGIARHESRKRFRDKQGQERSPVKRARGSMLRRVNEIGRGPDSPSTGHARPGRNARSYASWRLARSRALSTLWILILIGVLEEMIFRGFLVEVCFMIPQPALRVIALAGSVVVFGVGHVQFGWAQVLAKMPLGVLAMVSVLVLKTIVPAILIHVLFNWKVWDDTDGDLRVIFRTVW